MFWQAKMIGRQTVNKKKTALVTGASRGIGSTIAQHLADEFFVVGTATTDAGAAAISELLGENGTGIVMRIDDRVSVKTAYELMADTHNMPLVVVNNAGITRDNLLLRMKEEEWLSVVDTNLNGLYRIVKPALRSMIKARWGRLVNVSSVVAQMGNPGQSNYVASKAGIEGFTRALAQEVASRNITVNAIAPGFIETDMTAELTEDQVQQMLARIPLQRMGTTLEVAHAVSFLVSDQASYITGVTLSVNGGLHMS
ncbi:MAG: beta-ketoacyl-ACP reductase [Gammaproteobacteria bacterium]|nr:beta-ketoacyl-ACP reductase [Gammaproteobacteria bacterium]